MSEPVVRLELAGAVATVTIDRPAALNALDAATLEQLLAAFGEIARRQDVRVVVLTGAGDKAFVAGADIRAMSELSPREGRRFAELGLAVLAAIEHLDAPVIAAVNGFALGGGTELALACDLVYASAKAKFGQPEVNLGVIPGFGGTQRLPRLVGRNVGKELVFTGGMITAERAYQLGLVNAVFPPEELLARVYEVARTIAEKAPLAIAAAKRAINEGIDLPLASGLALEKAAFASLFATDDQREGMKAFLEKRKPDFRGE